ncbi:MAG: hypothetical protein ACM3MD_05585, partial [Betaproteobacteria bacterium]
MIVKKRSAPADDACNCLRHILSIIFTLSDLTRYHFRDVKSADHQRQFLQPGRRVPGLDDFPLLDVFVLSRSK